MRSLNVYNMWQEEMRTEIVVLKNFAVQLLSLYFRNYNIHYTKEIRAQILYV